MTPRRQMLIAAVGAALVTVLFFVFALRPKLSQIGEVRDEIEQAQAEQRRLEDQLEELQQAREDRPRTVARLALANRYVPADPDLPGFILVLQSASTASGIDLESIAPSPPRELEGATGVQAIDVTLTVRGGFHRLQDFLLRLESLERLVEVRSLTVSPQAVAISDQVTLSTTIALQMYVAEPEARAGAAARPTTPSTNEETES